MRKTLTQYLVEQRRAGAPQALTAVIEGVAQACVAIASAVNRGGLEGVLGALDNENIQGEVQKKLDVIANDIMLAVNGWSGHVAAQASEEMDTIAPDAVGGGEYLLVYDPIDGSSNIDVNGVVGTIFSVLKAPDGRAPAEADFLQAGATQVAAGYAIYGPQTVLVLTLGQGTLGFSLDRETGSWILTAEAMQIPRKTKEFSINMAYQRHWRAPVGRYVDEVLAGKAGPRGVDFNMRWMGSMVGDVHRVLTRGGVFMYPADQRPDMAAGKLRLMYEANPIALLVEQAGGMATDGERRILDIPPERLHQRTGVVLGSADEVALIADYHREVQPA